MSLPEDARPALRQISPERSLFSGPFQKSESLAVCRDAHAAHAELRPICESSGFFDRSARVLIELHFPKIASAAKKGSGLGNRIEQSSIGQPNNIIYSFHFTRAKYGDGRPAIQIAAQKSVPRLVGRSVQRSFPIRRPI